MKEFLRIPAHAWPSLRLCLPPFIVFTVCAVILFTNIGARYLWQDEAATAVLAERMMVYGRPLAYDGRNLITMDMFFPQEIQKLPTGNPAEAVLYYSRRGDFKADTTWTGQPWGQFIVAGVSLALFGHGTIPARLPFVLAGALTAALLFAIVRRRLGSSAAAFSSAILLIGNPFWIMHMRQCRYYALSSLFLLLTLESYLRWKEGRRSGAFIFVITAWIWFQVDFGSLWPVLVVLGLDAVISRDRSLKETILAFVGFCALTIPFCFYYEIAGRIRESTVPWTGMALSMFFQLNQFQLPLLMVPLALVLLWIDRRSPSNTKSHLLVGLSLAIALPLTMWMSLVSSFPFYRYIVPVTTLSAIVVAYVIVESARRLPGAKTIRWLVPSVVTAVTLFFVITNLPSRPGTFAIPSEYHLEYYTASVVRPELELLVKDIEGWGKDPNQAVVEFLRPRLAPNDEILCNYEDIPLMFYLKNPVRGGISCFRVSDAGNVRFVVYRQGMSFSHDSLYQEQIRKSVWQTHLIDAPDIPWGNFPDPRFQFSLLSAGAAPLKVLERQAP